jgi:predicted RNase H-like HicB family nuclease
MISSLTEHGRIGLTAVGQSPEEAMRIYEDAQEALFAEAAAAREESSLPG